MTQEEKFLDALKKFTAVPSMVVPGNVTAVDEAGKTCDVKPLDGGAALLSVKLKPTKSSKSGFWMIPSIGSAVLVGRVNNNDNFTYLAMMSDVDKVLFVTGSSKFEILSTGVINMTTGGTSLKMSGTGLVANGGLLGGVPVSKAVQAKLNLIEADLNALKLLFGTLASQFTQSPTTPVLGAQILPFAAYAAVPLVLTTPVELENPKVKQ